MKDIKNSLRLAVDLATDLNFWIVTGFWLAIIYGSYSLLSWLVGAM